MHQDITPIAVRPWTLNGISERMIVSHYENNYGGAVRTLNAIRSELAGLETGMPGYRIRALKREELIAMGSVALHELYFGNLGGEGNKIPDAVCAMLEEHFGSVARWRREFVETAQSLAGAIPSRAPSTSWRARPGVIPIASRNGSASTRPTSRWPSTARTAFTSAAT